MQGTLKDTFKILGVSLILLMLIDLFIVIIFGKSLMSLGLALISGSGVCVFLFYKFFINIGGKKDAISRWDGINLKSKEQLLKESAQKELREGFFNIAEDQFRTLMKTIPFDLETRLGFAESLFGQAILGDVRKDREKKTEALEHFRWALDYYLRKQDHDNALKLYKKILGPYSIEEIGEKFKPLISESAQAIGTVAVHDGHDLIESKRKLHAEFDELINQGKLLQAQAVLEEILKYQEIYNMEPTFLCRLADVSLRAGNQRTTERIYEEVSKRGDERQTVKALGILARFWLNTPKQLHLAHLYKGSAERFVTIDDSPEWVELGQKLRQ
jgi:tetratricopeptide (TPR) repeat protein